MRITNSMIRNNVLWNINRNDVTLQKYQTQLSTGKKIQRPSEDPIVAVRALKFRTNVREIAQYKSNNDDAKSWLSVTEQAMKNSLDLLQRGRELSVQAASDIYTTTDRANIASELNEIKTQIFNEANVNYAGRYVFSGFKTDTSVVYNKDTNDIYEITEHIDASKLTTKDRVVGENVISIPRYRLGYKDVSAAAAPVVPSNIPAPYTMVTTSSLGAGLAPGDDPYLPPMDTIYFLEDTGELIFNQANVDGTAPAAPFPANIDFTYEKNTFVKGDLNPKLFFESVNQATGESYTPPSDAMLYQISYSQDIKVNTNARDLFTVDMYRDLEEAIDAIGDMLDDGSVEQSLQEDILGDVFKSMIGKMDNHINGVVIKQAEVGGRVNRLDLTMNRLEDDLINFTELMSMNEDVNMTEALLNLRAQEVIYNASLQTSTQVMQQSLLDFMR